MGLINCPECRKEISEKATICPNCGYPMHDPNENKEIIIISGVCNRIKNKFFVQNGSAILTNKRFIYMKHSLPKTAVMGALVNFTSGKFEFDIPVSNIKSIEDGRQGVSKTIVINTKSGDSFNFYFTNREKWKIELGNYI